MSVLLSWHEKVRISTSYLLRFPLPLLTSKTQLVEIAGPGSCVRVMTDRRTV